MPVLSGFLPIPLAMMIPFMGAQSLVLGKQFGEGFQYGKRKISAMTNEEFNKITPQKLAQNNANELRQMIPDMKRSITDMREFQSFIVKELIATAKQLPNDIFQGVTNSSASQTSTSFIDFSDSGTVTDVRLRQDPKDVGKTKELIDELALAYMEATGLADFERAKEKIRQLAKTKQGLKVLNQSIQGGRQIVTGQRATVTPRAAGGSRLAAAKLQHQERIQNQQQRVIDLENKLKQILQQITEVRRRLRLTTGSKSKLVMKKLVIALTKQSLNTQKTLRTARTQLQQLKR